MIIYSGQKIGRLTAIKFSHKKGYATYWEFKCDCGKNVKTRATTVVTGNVRSCGCLRKEYSKVSTYKALRKLLY